jgi:vitamin B12 transporter
MRVLSKVTLQLVAGAVFALAGLPRPAATAQPAELPGITVQSTTIAARPVAPPAAPAAQGASAAAGKAQSTEAGDDAAGVPMERVGSAVSVVTREQLDRMQIRHAADALRSLPGVSVSQQGTAGNLTVVRIRGAESRHTLVLIDGVEVNSGTDGFFDFSNLNADDIERIEVLRGPQSGLYGNGALGGVISITTKQGRGPLTLSLRQEAGSRNGWGTTAQLSGGNDRIWGSAVINRRQTDGFNIATSGAEDDGLGLRSFAFRGGARLFENFALEGTVREQRTRADYDNLNGSYKGFLFVPSDAPFVSDARLRIGGLQGTLATFNKTWIHKFSISGAETVRDDFAPALSETTSTNSKYGYATTVRLDGPAGSPMRHFITGLIEHRTETFEQPNFSKEQFERERTSLVGEVRGEYFNSLFLSGTLRQDRNTLFEDFSTWHTAASLKVPGSIFRLHASAGTGVKYPSFGDLFGFFLGFVPNPNLKPEESFGYDAGIETTLFNGMTVVDVTYFKADLTNEIAFANFAGPFTLFNRSGNSTREGVEVAARFQLGGGLSLGGAYTFLNAKEDTGLEEIRRPRNSGRIDVNYAFLQGRGNVNVAAIYNGDMKDLAVDAGFNTARVALDRYWLVNATASYKLLPGVEVFGRVENILDDHYQEVFGYNATAGTTAFAGVKLTFGGPDGIGGSWAK